MASTTSSIGTANNQDPVRKKLIARCVFLQAKTTQEFSIAFLAMSFLESFLTAELPICLILFGKTLYRYLPQIPVNPPDRCSCLGKGIRSQQKRETAVHLQNLRLRILGRHMQSSDGYFVALLQRVRYWIPGPKRFIYWGIEFSSISHCMRTAALRPPFWIYDWWSLSDLLVNIESRWILPMTIRGVAKYRSHASLIHHFAGIPNINTD